ncbi:hypothetical protein STEG23_038174, partial [Scotinomys teguina]
MCRAGSSCRAGGQRTPGAPSERPQEQRRRWGTGLAGGPECIYRFGGNGHSRQFRSQKADQRCHRALPVKLDSALKSVELLASSCKGHRSLDFKRVDLMPISAPLSAATCSVAYREQPIFTTRAHVFQIDPSTKKNWVPASKQAVTVSYFYDVTRNSYRIISVDGAKVVINSTITPNMTFTKTSQKFGQWADSRANTVFGLGFSSEQQLTK